MLIYGWKAVHVKSVQSKNSSCPHCGASQSLIFHIYSKHAHIFWIPLFPIGKTGIAECLHCKYTLKPREMPVDICQEYKEIKAYIRPFSWQFIGGGLLVLLALFILYGTLTEKKTEAHYIAYPQPGDLYYYVNDGGKYSTARVYRVSKDSAYINFNEFQIDNKRQIHTLEKTKYTDTAYPVALERLQELYQNGDIYRVYRKGR